MKRVLIMAVAAVMLFAPAANAQKNVNEGAIRQKLEKSDAEIADAKKNTKAATWINRGKVYFESVEAPTKFVIPNTDPSMLKVSLGNPTSESDAEMVYPWVTIILRDGRSIAWVQPKMIKDGAIDVAFEAFQKAYDLDPKQAPKIKSELEKVINYYRNVGAMSYEIPRYDIAADAYEKIFVAQSNPAYGTPDYENLFLAGQLAAYTGANDVNMFVKGQQLLEKALANGYADEKGDIYYYLFHCFYGQKELDAANVVKSKNALLEGIAKFPKNDHILDGLMQLYTSEEGVGDPADLIELIDKALADEPDNADLWFGRGRVYYKLNNFDECINSFKKVVEIKPDLFEGNYYLALFYMAKGDQVREEVNSRDYKSQSEYDAEWQKVIQVYKDTVPWFEKALELNPQHLDTVDCLKTMYARLRDEGDEYMEKFNKYTEMYRQMSGN